MDYEIIQVRRGGEAFVIDNYLYIRSALKKSGLYLMCRSKGCPVRCKIINDKAQYTSPSTTHAHAVPNVGAYKFREDLRKKALAPENLNVSLREVLTEAQKEFSESGNGKAVLSNLPQDR